MSADWFNWYIGQTNKQKAWAMYDICPICFWEDDGQDNDDAEIIRGGSNADYSLNEARENFKRHHTMYRISDTAAFNREMTAMPTKKKMYQAFCKPFNQGMMLTVIMR